jgi:hypothetical protein
MACHYWWSIAETGCLQLRGPDMRQFRALCNKGYYLCRDEYYLYKEWEELTRAKPRYISIMDGLTMEDDEQDMNDKKNPYNNRAYKNCCQAFFWRIIS